MHWAHLALVATALAEVVTLKSTEFKPESMHGTWVVKFFSPYCGGCNLYAPVYEESEAKAREKHSDVIYAAVNCIENGDLCVEQNVKAWPFLKVYHDGKFVADAEVNRESSDVLNNFLDSLKIGKDAPILTAGGTGGSKGAETATQASSTETASTETVSTKTASTGTASTETASASTADPVKDLKDLKKDTIPGLQFVKFFSPYCAHCQEYAPIFERIAKALPEAQFAQVNCIENGDLCKEADIKMWPVVRAYRDGKLDKEFEERDFTYKGTTKWLKQFGLDPKAAKEKADGSHVSTDASTHTSSALAKATGAEIAQQDKSSADFIPSNLPAPVWTTPITVTHADGKSRQLNKDEFNELVTNSGEPWMVKFFHPQCPHCKAMAPEWEKYAQHSKDKMNVAQVSCESDFEFCLANGVKSYPTIFFYVKGTKHMFTGGFSLEEFQNYDRLQTGAQILHVRTPDELEGFVNADGSDGVGTFVYLYDESVTNEDWDALALQAKQFPEINSVLFHTSSNEIRKNAGVDTHGTALIYVAKFDNPETKKTETFYHVYPESHTPELLRDVDSVVEWANKVRFSSPVLLRPDQVPRLSRHAGISVVQLNLEGELPTPQLRYLAKQAHESAEIKQAHNQQSLRDQRSEMYESLRTRGKLTVARSVLITPINAPLVGERTYGFTSREQWQKQFDEYLDTQNHSNEDVLVVDWYNGKYVDSLGDDTKLRLDDVDRAIQALSEKGGPAKKFKKNFRKLPKPFNPEMVFKPNLNLGQNIQKMEKKHLSLSGVVLAVIAFFIGKSLYKVLLKLWREPSGPILTGKMD